MATKKAKKAKKPEFNEYKLKVEIKSGDVIPVKLTLYEAKEDRQGAQLVLFDDLVIKGLWVINGKNGPFISWPSYKSGDDYKDYIFPISAEFRESLYDQILKLSDFDEEDEED